MGFCPRCGAELSVGDGEEDWCLECEDLVKAQDSPPDPLDDFIRGETRGYISISSGVEERWYSRVEANGWQYSEEGAKSYLKKYGRNIGAKKVREFANLAESRGYSNFARGMWKKLHRMLFV